MLFAEPGQIPSTAEVAAGIKDQVTSHGSLGMRVNDSKVVVAAVAVLVLLVVLVLVVVLVVAGGTHQQRFLEAPHRGSCVWEAIAPKRKRRRSEAEASTMIATKTAWNPGEASDFTAKAWWCMNKCASGRPLR